MAKETLLDVINASLDGDAAPDTDEELEVADDGVDEGADDTNDEGGEADESAEADEGDESADADAEGDEPAAGAKPAAKVQTPEEIAAAAAAQPKVKDPVNDPIPNALKAETKERMVSLISTVKAVTGERDKAVAEQREFMSHIEATGSTPEQYSQSLQVLGMLNSGEPTKVKQAIAYLQQVIASNAAVVGEPIEGVSMLANHPDLVEGVEGGHISQQHAEELAAARERNKFQQTQGAQRQQSQQATQQWQNDLTAGKQSLNTLDAELRRDPQYAEKRAVLVPALQPMFAKTHPSLWAASFKAAWDKLKLPAARVAVPGQRTNVPANQPMRAKAGAGGGNPVKKPGSMFDALNSALGG